MGEFLGLGKIEGFENLSSNDEYVPKLTVVMVT